MLRAVPRFAARTTRTTQLRRFCSVPKPFESIPGPPQNERGSADDLMGRVFGMNVIDGINSYYPEFGNIVRHNLMGQNTVYVFHPDDHMHVFRNDNAIPHGPVGDLWPVNTYTQVRGRKFPLSSMGEDWKRARAALQKDIFSPAVANSYIPALNEPVKAASAVFDKAPLDKLIPYAAFDMFATAILGRNFDSTARSVIPNRQRDETDEFVDHSMKALSGVVELTFDFSAEGQAKREERLGRFFHSMDKVVEYSTKFLEQVRANPRSADIETKSYFERIIARSELPADEIAESIVSFLFAGVDTTNHVSLWTFLNLAKYPEIQEKVYQEIKTHIGDGPITEQNLKALEYLGWVQRESHRLTPSSSIITTRTLDHPIVLSGYEIPPGTKINMASNAIQRDPKFVDEPEKFIPERWSKEAIASRKGTPKEAIDSLTVSKPFGMGPRMCLGSRLAEAEMKMLAVQVVRDWKFEESPPNQPYKIIQKTMSQAEPYPSFNFQRR